MKKIITLSFLFALLLVSVPAAKAEAGSVYYTPYYVTGVSGSSSFNSEQDLINYLIKLIAQLQIQIASKNNSFYDHKYTYVIGEPRSGNSSDDEPEVETETARYVSKYTAELRGNVDMNDFRNGEVFFVYGQDESQIEDVEDDYDSYRDVDEDGKDLQKIRVDSDLDGDEDYIKNISGLEDNEDYYYQICVGFEDEDGDDVLTCGGVEDFSTDGSSSSNDDAPEIDLDSAYNITDDSVTLRGSVDMNDFDNGDVFFVYGQDEDQVADIEDDYDTYGDIDEDGDDLQKVRVDSDADGNASYKANIGGLDDDTDYYFNLCVAYEDEDGDDVILCDNYDDFTTDN